ncbi:FmdB family zinc ribbon protein [Deinococcus sp. KNUC1210]|uniref:FmdB family zinc ribbon protein n=1 Tax=Deinococcus sp. KNUC1210 TaxID=2917691 RepID=UPI00351DA812
MPTYEYKNIETGERYEFKQSMKDAALTHHPETGVPIRRVVSRPAIAFKGSGFYANDSRSSSGSSSEKTSSAGTSSSDKSSSDKAAPAPSTPAASKGGE